MISYLLIVCMVVTYALPNSLVKAKENKISGQCGPTAYFQLEKDGTLRITGSGYIDINQFQDLQDAHLEDKTIRIVLEKDIKNVPDEIFKNYTKVVEVELPNHLETIGKNSFANCTALKEIILPRWLKTVDDYAFFNCTSLESVYMLLCTYTKSYTNYEAGTISDYAFYGCNNIKVVLTGVSQPSKMPQQWPETIEKAYGNKRCKIWQYTGENVEKIKLSAASTPSDSINYVIFGDELSIINNEGVIDTEISCNSKKVIVCGDITAIEEGGFKNYTNLEEIYLPESIERIEYGAFRGDSKLKEITIPSKVPKIENHTFDNCPELTTMTIKNPNIELAKKGMPMNLKTIYGFRNSTAQQYAEENGIEFISIDIDKEEETTTTESTTQATTITTTSQITTPELITDSITSETTAGSTTVPKISETVTDPKVETTENTTETEETTMNSTTVNVTSADVSTTTEESKTNESFSEESISDLTTDKIFSTTIITEKQSFEVVTSGETGRKEKLSLSRVKEKNYHTVRLIWKKINTSKDYEIYRAEKKSGKYISVKKLKSGVYSDSKVKAGKKYFYKIKTTSNDGKVIWSGTKEIYVKGTPNRPKLSIKKTKSKWTLTWGIIGDNSKGLQVYMKTSKKGKFVKVNEVNKLKKKRNKKGITGMSGSRSSLDKKVTYFFKVRTYAVVNGKKVYSRWSKVKKMKG